MKRLEEIQEELEDFLFLENLYNDEEEEDLCSEDPDFDDPDCEDDFDIDDYDEFDIEDI